MSKNYKLLVFDNEEDLVKTYAGLIKEGIQPRDIFTPYPVHGILEELPYKTRITHAAFFFGVAAAAGILGFLYYAAVISWPIEYGGKPVNSFPSFIVVTIVATILVITLLTLFTFSVRSEIYPGKKPVILHPRATDDRFVVVLDEQVWEHQKEKIESLIHGHVEIE